MLAVDYVNHFIYQIRMFGRHIMVFMDIGG